MDFFYVMALAFLMIIGIFYSASLLTYLVHGRDGSYVIGNYYILWLFFGWKRVLLYDGQRYFNEDFKTVAKFNKEGKFTEAFRYPNSFIGKVQLNPDGTAEYCGSYKWKFI